MTSEPPQGVTGTWSQDEGGKGGRAQSCGMATDAGTWRGAQRRAADYGGLQVAGTVNVQVVGASHRERSWGEISNRYRATNMNGCWWGEYKIRSI